ncbi:TetR/AcrR family transcriptional regulator (plasmid) [Arthrobacter sp. D3-18]
MSTDTKQRIASTALDLFHANGYSATGVSDIARAAGVPKGSFYHFFESKEALAAETVKLYETTINYDLLDRGSPSPLARIKSHLTFITAMAETDDFQRGCLLGNFSTEMPSQSATVTAAVERSLELWTGKLAKAISQAQTEQEISNRSDPQRLAGFIIASFEGAVARSKLTRSRAPLDGFLETVYSDILA